MSTHRRVEWQQTAKSIFNAATDNSLDLYLFISHACANQSGEGLEELIHAINEDNTKRKIKKITIVDTSYLYRHCIKEFSRYSDPNVETEWFLKNKAFIAKIECPVEMKAWIQDITGENFKYWEKRIMIDFAGDKNGHGIIQQFRDSVMQEAAVTAYTRNYAIDDCVNFVLEKCIHACANLKDALIIYPSKTLNSMILCSIHYNLGFHLLRYNVSKQVEQYSATYNPDMIDREIVRFMKEGVTNVDFFVIDKYGNHLYKNYTHDNIVQNMNAMEYDSKAWEISKEVMRTRKQIIAEEKGNYDNYYLSVKTPLIINNEVEGIIGLAINITDRKKTEMLELKNKLQQIRIQDQEEFKMFTARMAHDIMSPLITLQYIVKSSVNIPEKEHIALREVASSIKNIANTLLERYEADEKQSYEQQEQYILVQLAIMDILDQKKYRYKDNDINFSCSFDPEIKFTFIKGNQANFKRMISTLINNSIEAIENKHGSIKISVTAEKHDIKITIEDNGRGMPQDIIDKIKNNAKIKTTQKESYASTLGQTLDMITLYKGKFAVESRKDIGTTFSIKFPISEKPKWIAEKIVLNKGDTVVILDDDSSIFNIWKEILKNYEDVINIKHFTNEREASDFLDSFRGNDNLYLISDFELRDQRKNGLLLILENKMRNKSLLVTSIHNNNKIYSIAKHSGVKIIPKQFLYDVPIVIQSPLE